MITLKLFSSLLNDLIAIMWLWTFSTHIICLAIIWGSYRSTLAVPLRVSPQRWCTEKPSIGTSSIMFSSILQVGRIIFHIDGRVTSNFKLQYLQYLQFNCTLDSKIKAYYRYCEGYNCRTELEVHGNLERKTVHKSHQGYLFCSRRRVCCQR